MFCCDDKFTSAHKFQIKQAFVMQIKVDDGDDEEDVEQGRIQENTSSKRALELQLQELQLSSNAAREIPRSQNMRIEGSCGKRVIQVFIYTGSTPNCLKRDHLW